ncbi:MAG TPA: hypothetical protein VHG29_01345 [Novosphingobium sp.]|nr:hypothetical protein [Novosphingobium sp.]
MFIFCVGFALAGSGHAQDATDRRVDAAIANQKAAYGPPSPRKRCGVPDDSGDIVVCAPDNSEFRVQSTAQSNPRSREALNTGIPRAPNLSTLPDCSQGCISIGSVPPPIYMIDFSQLPNAPAGSDADLIAKGERPAP